MNQYDPDDKKQNAKQQESQGKRVYEISVGVDKSQKIINIENMLIQQMNNENKQRGSQIQNFGKIPSSQAFGEESMISAFLQQNSPKGYQTPKKKQTNPLQINSGRQSERNSGRQSNQQQNVQETNQQQSQNTPKQKYLNQQQEEEKQDAQKLRNLKSVNSYQLLLNKTKTANGLRGDIFRYMKQQDTGLTDKELRTYLLNNIQTLKDFQFEFGQHSDGHDLIQHIEEQIEKEPNIKLKNAFAKSMKQELFKILNKKNIKKNPEFDSKVQDFQDEFNNLISKEQGQQYDQNKISKKLNKTLTNENFKNQQNDTIIALNNPQTITKTTEILNKEKINKHYSKLDSVHKTTFLLDLAKRIEQGYIKEGMEDDDIISKVNSDISTLSRNDNLELQINKIKSQIQVQNPDVLSNILIKNNFGTKKGKKKNDTQYVSKINAKTIDPLTGHKLLNFE